MELRLPLELFMGFQAPCQTVCGICRFFQTMHGGVSDPSFCVFIHRVAFEEVSGHRVLMKSGPGYRGRSAFGTTHVGCLEFPHETGLILKCAAKVMKLFQTKQRNRPSCGDQEGTRGRCRQARGEVASWSGRRNIPDHLGESRTLEELLPRG